MESYKSELAYYLFESLQLGAAVNPQYEKEIQKLKSECKNFREMLFRVINLIGYPETVKEKYTYAYAYYWLGAEYRPQAINAFVEYIRSGCLPDVEKRYIPEFDFYANCRHNRASAFHDLGVCFEKEYQFENAMRCYSKALKTEPFYECHYIFIARLYAKMNNLSEGISFMTDVQKTNKYYRMSHNTNGTFAKAIDIELEELISKKERSYVYRPRKKAR